MCSPDGSLNMRIISIPWLLDSCTLFRYIIKELLILSLYCDLKDEILSFFDITSKLVLQFISGIACDGTSGSHGNVSVSVAI